MQILDYLKNIFISLNPLEIVSKTDGSDNFNDMAGADIFSLLSLNGLFTALKNNLFLIATCAITIALVGMYFVKNPQEVADKKKDILHKLLIVFIAASLLTLLNLLYNFFSNLF